MGTHFPEPTLAELLSDPVTRAVMQADGVNPWELEEPRASTRPIFG
jgi:hypothetical protein